MRRGAGDVIVNFRFSVRGACERSGVRFPSSLLHGFLAWISASGNGNTVQYRAENRHGTAPGRAENDATAPDPATDKK